MIVLISLRNVPMLFPLAMTLGTGCICSSRARKKTGSICLENLSFGIKSIEQKSQARLRNFLPMPMYSENSAIIIAMVMTKELMGGNGAKIPLGTSPANKNQEGSQKSFPFYKRYPYGREGRKSDGRISVVDLSHRVDSHWSRCFYRGA